MDGWTGCMDSHFELSYKVCVLSPYPFFRQLTKCIKTGLPLVGGESDSNRGE